MRNRKESKEGMNKSSNKHQHQEMKDKECNIRITL